MGRLEDLTRGAQVSGIRSDGAVTVVDAKWFGATAVELTYKDVQGRPGNELLYRADEARGALFSTELLERAGEPT